MLTKFSLQFDFLYLLKAIVATVAIVVIVVTVATAVTVATVVGIVHVRTMDIVDLQGAHHIESVVIILQDTRRPMVEDQGEIGPGHHCPILLAQKGSMLVVLDDAVRLWHPLQGGEEDLEVCEPVMVM